VNVGSAAEDKDRFLNLRAELYWKTAEWLKHGNKLIGKGSFDEILDVRWKTQSDRKIKIKPKEEMREEGIESPDVADVLMLSFAKEGYSADVKDDTDELFERHNIFPIVA
jgi:phage terminase large subunit